MAGQPAPDRYQRRHRWLALPIAVVYKFADDQGAYLAALITYYAVISVFPLLLLLVSVLGFVLHGDLSLQHRILNSALAQFPIIGKQISTNLHGYHGSGPGLVVGVLGSLYGGLGVAQAGQNAMNVVWAVPKNERPDPIKSRLRSIAVIAAVGAGVLATTGLSAATTGPQSFVHSLRLGVLARLLSLLASLLLNVVIFVVAFRLLTDAAVPLRSLALGAVVAAVVWQVLQALGTYYLGHELRGSSEVYGAFALVLGLIAWVHVGALVVVLCAELNVVVRRRLWPRALLTPFTDDVELTAADERAYAAYAKAQRNKGFETIDVGFERDSAHEPRGGTFGSVP